MLLRGIMAAVFIITGTTLLGVSVVMIISSPETQENETLQLIGKDYGTTPPTQLAVEDECIEKNDTLHIIGIGDSDFRYSDANRVHNIRQAINRINGKTIRKNEEFSFLKTIGSVRDSGDFLPAKIIANGTTKKEKGGGVCQVATTMFRAMLDAGVYISERHNHSIVVSYYLDKDHNSGNDTAYNTELKPGRDATVYGPDKDLKFINNTAGDILIETAIDSPSVYVYFRGIPDPTRKVTITPIVVLNTIKSNTLYIPFLNPIYDNYKDSILFFQKGMDGCSTSFSRIVYQGNQVIDSTTFVSNYKPFPTIYKVNRESPLLIQKNTIPVMENRVSLK